MNKPVDFSETPIAAIFVFHDPRNWSLDIQVMCDVIQSGGMIGAPRDAPVGHHGPGRRQVDLMFCNPDIMWRSDFERPRLGQGAFREAFQAVYKVRGVRTRALRAFVFKFPADAFSKS